jgi:hypothetical protein
VTQKEYADNRKKDSEKLDFSANITDTNNIINGNFWFTDNQKILTRDYPLTRLHTKLDIFGLEVTTQKAVSFRINPSYFETDRQQNKYGTYQQPRDKHCGVFTAGQTVTKSQRKRANE